MLTASGHHLRRFFDRQPTLGLPPGIAQLPTCAGRRPILSFIGKGVPEIFGFTVRPRVSDDGPLSKRFGNPNAFMAPRRNLCLRLFSCAGKTCVLCCVASTILRESFALRDPRRDIKLDDERGEQVLAFLYSEALWCTMMPRAKLGVDSCT